MPISEAHQKNFDTLSAAFQNGDVALMECTDKQDGKPKPVLCATGRADNGDYLFIPFALMLPEDAENPFERFVPPGGEEDTCEPT